MGSCLQTGPVMTKMTHHVFLFLYLVFHGKVDAFKTAKCGHQEILNSFENYKICYEKRKTSIEKNFCLGFEAAEQCTRSSYKLCFDQEKVDIMAQNAKAELRIFGIQTLKQLKFPEFIAESLYNSCPKAPSSSEVEQVDKNSFSWLNHVSTDGLCDNIEKNNVEQETTDCFNEEGENFKTEIQENAQKARGNLKSTICGILQYTVANCVRKEYPSCFSAREEKYLKGLMLEGFKTGYGLMRKLVPEWKIPRISPECLE